MMQGKAEGFALYRMPFEQECTLMTGDADVVDGCLALTGRQGFVVAPFAPAAGQPIVVIRPSHMDSGPLHTLAHAEQRLQDAQRRTLNAECPTVDRQRADYHEDFDLFHSRLTGGYFQKLVLARQKAVMRTGDTSPLTLFRRATERYPRMFIALVSTPQSGLWLTATPEILLSGDGHDWQTIALAGTMPWAVSLQWSEKNIREQRLVADYIAGRLRPFCQRLSAQGPYTARAGHLAHLRTDFHFTLSAGAAVGDVTAALHPTPAVCGLPKADARRFILEHEHGRRSYYSGFMGPLAVQGRTRLFVTLRCMQLFQNAYLLYAGGGLLSESVEDQEWLETESKMQTMLSLI